MEEAEKYKTLKYLNPDMCVIGYTHQVSLIGHDPLQVLMASVKATILTNRYPLTGLKCAGRKQLPSGPYRDVNELETLEHFIIRCPLYTDIRQHHVVSLQKDHKLTVQNISDEDILKMILD